MRTGVLVVLSGLTTGCPRKSPVPQTGQHASSPPTASSFGSLLIIGGDSAGKSSEIYNASSGEVCPGPELPVERVRHTVGQFRYSVPSLTPLYRRPDS